jgi:flagellar FliL protein
MAEAAVASQTPGQDLAPKGGKKKLILIAAAAVLVLGAGGAWFFLKPAAGTDAKAKHEPVPKAEALYYAMEPPFVVNFEPGANARFLQVAVQLMTRDPHTIEELKKNDPAIRNDLLLMYGTQTLAGVSNLEGKEKLRQATLEAVRKAIAVEGVRPETVEAAYFTSFVTQ